MDFFFFNSPLAAFSIVYFNLCNSKGNRNESIDCTDTVLWTVSVFKIVGVITFAFKHCFKMWIFVLKKFPTYLKPKDANLVTYYNILI